METGAKKDSKKTQQQYFLSRLKIDVYHDLKLMILKKLSY